MDNDNIIECDFGDCENHLPKDKMERYSDGYDTYYVCPACEDKVDDQTGFCPLSCQMGQGCDESC